MAAFLGREVMRYRACFLLLAAVSTLTVFASTAKATPVNITYNIQVNVGLPAFGVQGFVGTGQLKMELANGTSGSHVGPGPIHVVSGYANLAANFTVFADLITGYQNIIFQGSGTGSATPSGSFNLATSGYVASGMLHCLGATCTAALGLFQSLPVFLTGQSVPLNLMSGVINGFPSVGLQTFSAFGTAGTLQNFTLTVVLTGQEIFRDHVQAVIPEPGSVALFGLGTLIVGSFVWRRSKKA
jgi:hypothetical protein